MKTRALVFPPRKILVPLDATPVSVIAWRAAKELAASFGAEVRGVYVHESFYFPEMPPAPMDPEGQLRELRNKLGASHDEVGLVLGDAGATILNWGRNLDYDLVVMGTHGRTGFERALAGSVAEEVVRRSTVPVLVVRRPLPRIKHVLAPVNFERYAQAGVDQAAEIAQALGARLTVLHVVDAPVYGGAGALKAARHLLADVVNRLPAAARAACKPKTQLALGRPAEQIALAAKTADLVVLVAHRRGFLGDALLGTTAERLLRRCRSAVLALPAGTPAEAEKPRKPAEWRRKLANAPLF